MSRKAGSSDCIAEAENNRQIVVCLKSELSAEEGKLRGVEARYRGSMPDTARATFDTTVVAWTRYRDSECQSVYASYNGGRDNLVAMLSCRVTLTAARRKLLADLYSFER